MKCNEIRRLLEFARPGVTELEAVDIVAIERHLADCASCATFTRADRAIDDEIAQTMQAVELPPGARGRLLERATDARRSWRRKRVTVVFAAACVLGFGWWLYPAPKLDTDAIANVAWERFNNQIAAEEWLAQQNRNFGFPPRFKAKYLIGYETRDFHGVSAPVLTFVKRNSLARVVVLAENQFRNLSGLPDGPVADNSAMTLLVIHDPTTSGVVYWVEVLNGPVDPFYVDEEPSVT
ncbi:MAG: anti-sigma factor family protein [Gemmataceae bacterium]